MGTGGARRNTHQYPGAKGGGGRYSSGSQPWASGRSTGSWADRALTTFPRQALTPENASLQLAGLESLKTASLPLGAWGSAGLWREVVAAQGSSECLALSQLDARVTGLWCWTRLASPSRLMADRWEVSRCLTLRLV